MRPLRARAQRSARVTALAFILAHGFVTSGLAQQPRGTSLDDVGRFRVIPLPRTEKDFGREALVIDTTTGDLWRWWSSPSFGGTPGGEGLTYQGRAVPGKPGDVQSYSYQPPAKPAR